MIKSNEYFGGKVKSLGLSAEGGPATVGVIEAGEYEFGTTTVEIMRVVAGELDARLPDSDRWTAYPAGTSFTVPAGKKFSVRAKTEAAYLCLYR